MKAGRSLPINRFPKTSPTFRSEFYDYENDV